MSTSAAARLDRLMAADVAAYDRRVREEGESIAAAVDAGEFDARQPAIGLEYEFYAVDATGALTHVPEAALDCHGCEKEIGRHQIELHASAQPLVRDALTAQERELRARLLGVTRDGLPDALRLVSDGVWTVPPVDESAASYLSDAESVGDWTVARNMHDEARYHAQDIRYDAAVRPNCPNVDCSAETVLVNSLTTSIQPHYQVPEAADLPERFRYALRIAGPLLALGANAPFVPADLYEDVPPDRVLRETWMETRIPIFEGVMNPADGDRKVRFPRDLDSTAAAIERVTADPVVAPPDPESVDESDACPHFRHKFGSYWRWVRPVFDPVGENVRIEFRPLPGQPTLQDSVGLLALFAGLMERLPEESHPVGGLDWETARGNFYAAAADGLRADLTWIDADGRRTTETERIFADLFETARAGLRGRGLLPRTIDAYLDPLEQRWRHRTSPARWKHDRVGREIADGGPLTNAIADVQSEYVRRQADSFLAGDFGEWLSDRRSSVSDRVSPESP